MDPTVLQEGSFYCIKELPDCLVLEDKTKRGLAVRERSVDEKLGVDADKGMIHDMDGIGHWVAVRWFFTRPDYGLDQVEAHARDLEKRYTELRELTCPDD